MNKKQRQRREKQGRHHTEDTAKGVIEFIEEKCAHINQTEKSDSQKQPANKKKNTSHIQRFIELTNRNDGAVMAVLTAALVGIGITQACIYRSQLSVNRKDQRPWIKLTIDTSHDINNTKPELIPKITLTNIGKTPAKGVDSRTFIEPVRNGSEPTFSVAQSGRFTTGIMFPNDPHTMFGPINYPISAQQFSDFKEGNIFFVIYSNVAYRDVFGVSHWTKDCHFATASNAPNNYTAKKCTDYNDTDDN